MHIHVCAQFVCMVEGESYGKGEGESERERWGVCGWIQIVLVLLVNTIGTIIIYFSTLFKW